MRRRRQTLADARRARALPRRSGNAFNVLVNVTSVGLNGMIELMVPALLFLYFSQSFFAPSLRLGGLRADVATWRRVAMGVALLAFTLIVAAYSLNACVRLGVYGPLHKARHASEEEDYSHYAAYDDLHAPPSPLSATGAPVAAPAVAPAMAPSAAQDAGIVR